MSRIPAENLQRILASPTYIRAEDDVEFLKSPSLRPLRLAMELMKTEQILQAHGIHGTIVVFGGTRIIERAAAEQELRRAEARLAENPGDLQRARAADIARRRVASSIFYDEARKFGEIVGSSSPRFAKTSCVVVTGGGPGVMEAANRGAREAGAETIGLNITLPHEQVPNAYITPELCFQFHYFAIRKMHFLLRARAMVCFPGGFGTLDELFETLTLIQTKVMEPIPIVLFGRDYWTRVLNFAALVEEGTIAASDVGLFEFADKAEEAWHNICRFYERCAAVQESPIHRK